MEIALPKPDGGQPTLHDLDAVGLDCIVVALPPDVVAWQAIRDRLRRASSVGPPSA